MMQLTHRLRSFSRVVDISRYLGAIRRALFEQLDKPALKPLPAVPYEYAEWLERRAGLDYHVEVAKHYYSFGGLTRPHWGHGPASSHQLLKKPLWGRLPDPAGRRTAASCGA